MKNIVLVILTVLSFNLYGQVAIGDTNVPPNSSAVLDLTSTSKALYINRVALTGKDDLTTITDPQLGMLVINTATANSGDLAVEEGNIYGFNGTAWEKLINSYSLEQEIKKTKIPVLAAAIISDNNQVFTNLSGSTNQVSIPSGSSSITLSPEYIRQLSDTEFEILQDGTYIVDGSIDWAMTTSGSTFWTVEIRTTGGEVVGGQRCPYITAYASQSSECKFIGVKDLTAGTILVVNAIKKNGTTPTAASTSGFKLTIQAF